VDVDARIRGGRRLDLGFELEVLEVMTSDGAGVKQVRTRPTGDETAVLDLPGGLILVRLPAIERFAVEKRNPVLSRDRELNCETSDHNGKKERLHGCSERSSVLVTVRRYMKQGGPLKNKHDCEGVAWSLNARSHLMLELAANLR
jgi:hypothetical protein